MSVVGRLGATAISTVLLLSLICGSAVAREKITAGQGYGRCTNWCNQHNKTSASYRQCANACFAYWMACGSDTTGNCPSKR
jgi:hypothetical protein